MSNLDEYKWLLSVTYSDCVMYYNSAHYCLVGDPSDASRYKVESSEHIESEMKFASCQGGEPKMVLLETALNND